MPPPYQSIVTLDFETFFSTEYSLRRPELNTSEYVRDARFQVQCVGIKVDDAPVAWVRGRDAAAALGAIDWTRSALLAHHAAFDGLILAHHFGHRPAYYLDTLSMARALHSNAIGASLDTVAGFYRLGNKLPDVLDRTKGVEALPEELLTSLGQYCAVDVELCRLIFDRMRPGFPESELDLIDLTIRMFCEPVLRIDIARVEAALEEERAERAATIAAAGVSLAVLSSSDKFAQALIAAGVEPPRKTSPTTGRDTWAFAKTDLDFLALKGHRDARVRALAIGRLAAKSTIGESRAMRFLQVAANGALPVYLNYWGAHTGRWSAGNKMNLQNLKRGGELRKSILAPEGHAIVVADSSQIEARVLAWLAGDHELLALFASGADVYKHMASQIYGVPVEAVTKDQRFIGKIATLGLGFGMAWERFQHTLAVGAMGPAVQVDDIEAQRIVRMYRHARMPIAKLWRDMDMLLARLVLRRSGQFGPLRHDNECRVWLPNGLYLQYPFITADHDCRNDRLVDFRYFDYEAGIKAVQGAAVSEKHAKRIHGALLTENVVQALARIAVAEQMLAIQHALHEMGENRAGAGEIHRVVTMTHDEVVAVVPEARADEALALMLAQMARTPDWCPGLALAAEGGWAVNYSK